MSLRFKLILERLLTFLILLPQGIDTIDHLLDQLNLGVPKPVLVRDVIGVADLFTRLTMSAAGLQVQLLAALCSKLADQYGPRPSCRYQGW